MTLPSPIHRHINIRHSGRLVAGSAPACVKPRDEPTNAPQLFGVVCDLLIHFDTHAYASRPSSRIGGFASMSPTLTPQ
jgi:hypothetical protein